MTETTNITRAAPVVRMLIGLKQQSRLAKQERNNPATVDTFDREGMGIAAKE